MASILVCDDMRAICGVLEIALRKENHRVETVTAGSEAKRKLDSNIYDVVVSDIKMPQTDGIEVLRHARKVSPETAVILITAIEDYEAAVQAVKAGAFDYIHKGPHLIEEVVVAINRALESVELRRQNRRHPGGKRYRQGTGGPRHPRLLATGRRALRLHQLRRVSGNPARKRTVRLRQRRLYRRHPEQGWIVRGRQPRHRLPGRDQRDEPGHAGEAAAGAAGA